MKTYKRSDIRRMWVNQPSTLQPDHTFSGENVLVLWDEESDVLECFFQHNRQESSARIFKTSLSDGWRDKDFFPVFDEEKETKRGERLAEVLQLKKKRDNGRYDTSEGDKTALGLFCMIRRLFTNEGL